MDRNLSRRVEVVFPIEQPDLKQRVIEILKVTLADNVKARELLPDGTYRRVKPPEGAALCAASCASWNWRPRASDRRRFPSPSREAPLPRCKAHQKENARRSPGTP